MLHKCKTCGEDNLLSDEMRWSQIYATECKKCHNDRMKKFRKTEEGRRHTRNRMFKYKYGITIEEYEQIIKNQGNRCLVCKNQFSNKIRPDVDHHHKSKKVRGILCHACNLAIGYLKEDEDIIWNMLEYLKRTTWSEGEGDVKTVA